MEPDKERVEASFEELGLKGALLETLKTIGFTAPSAIQRDVIPSILSGADVVGQAQTGTGKTAAFALPCIQMLKSRSAVEIVVITPTRELAFQVSEEFLRFGGERRLKVATICGGKSFKLQLDAIRGGAQVVVATPGRLLDLLSSGKLRDFQPAIVVLDEADEMLNMGFLEDIQAIFGHLPEERQTLLFSATMPLAIRNLIKKILKDPLFVKAPEQQMSNKDIAQSYCLIQEHERDGALLRLFSTDTLQKSVVFCRTKIEVDRVSALLSQAGYAAKGLHGDMEQNQRERVIAGFRSGKVTALIATDVAARGLNIVDVTHVINFHLPSDAENYVHRIGRTGRAGREGCAITFVTPRELNRLLAFSKVAGGKIEKGAIPTKAEVAKGRSRRLIDEIIAQSLSEESRALTDQLKEKMDLELIACKLLSMLLDERPIAGPELIGATEEKRPSRFHEKRADKAPFRKKRPFYKKDRRAR